MSPYYQNLPPLQGEGRGGDGQEIVLCPHIRFRRQSGEVQYNYQVFRFSFE
jgi:hypothetical protein